MVIFSYFLTKTKPSKSRFFLALTFISVAFWNFCLLISVSLSDEMTKILFHELKYLGVTTLSVHIFLFTVYFSNLGGAITQRHITALYSFPIFSMLVVVTNNYHHLFRKSIWVGMQAGVGIVFTQSGILFYVIAFVMYSMSLLSTLICVNRIISVAQVHRMKYVMLLNSIIGPFVINAFYNVFDMNSQSIDPTPIVMGVMAILMYFAYKLDRAFDITPVAREQVFRQIAQPVFVTNTDYLINDFNAMAEKEFNLSAKDTLGQHIERICPKILTSNKLENQGRIYEIQKSDMVRSSGANIGHAFSLRDITEKELYMMQLQLLSYHDSLTDVYNKHYLNEWKDEIKMTMLPIGLIYSDMNFLKKINDTYGHEIGDQMIIDMARALKAITEDQGIVVRLGGDEFLIVLPSVSQEGLNEIVQKIKAIELPYEAISTSVSVGVEMMYDIKEDFYEVMKRADLAMYEDKKSCKRRADNYGENPCCD